jgi:hypothetical protein
MKLILSWYCFIETGWQKTGTSTKTAMKNDASKIARYFWGEVIIRLFKTKFKNL